MLNELRSQKLKSVQMISYAPIYLNGGALLHDYSVLDVQTGVINRFITASAEQQGLSCRKQALSIVVVRCLAEYRLELHYLFGCSFRREP